MSRGVDCGDELTDATPEVRPRHVLGFGCLFDPEHRVSASPRRSPWPFSDQLARSPDNRTSIDHPEAMYDPLSPGDLFVEPGSTGVANPNQLLRGSKFGFPAYRVLHSIKKDLVLLGQMQLWYSADQPERNGTPGFGAG
jgi:hypothetical protein